MLLRKTGALQHPAVQRHHRPLLLHSCSKVLFTSSKVVPKSASVQYAVLTQQQDERQQQHTTHDSTAVLQQTSKPPAVFRFRHFTLLHGRPCAMKMGTDAMLLGAWAQPPKHTAAVLDVGTGSGVLALMMAQKTQQQSVLVHALDIDGAAITQAAANAAASPWAHRVSVHLSSLQDWAQHSTARHSSSSSSSSSSNTPAGWSLTHQDKDSNPTQCSSGGGQTGGGYSCHSYDVIISNPPYFLQSSKPDQAHRAAARHADVTLPFAELACCAAHLLAPEGRLFVVLPVQEARVFVEEAAAAGLSVTRLTQVFMKRTDKQPKRHLMQFEHAAAPAAPTAAATAAVSATSPAALSVTGDRAAAIDDAATAAAPQIDSLIVLVQNQADSGCCSTAGNSGSNGSSSTGSKRPAAPWVFSEQYRQMTVDFHHPDLLA